MRTPDKPFSQEDFIAKSSFLGVTNPAGVCAILVAEWFTGGCSLGGASFSRRGRGEKASARIAGGMMTSRATSLADHGLQSVATRRSAVTDEDWPSFVWQEGYVYYVKFDGGAGGHAVGVINKGGKYRVFDPNHGQWDCKSAIEVTIILLQLVQHYRVFDTIEIERLALPSFVVV